jgi:hypothetical protein
VTVEVTRDTYRMLEQLAMLGGTTVDELSEQILTAFATDVMTDGSVNLAGQIEAMLP